MNIEDVIARKKEVAPQYEYMWRVTLPEINSKGLNDSFGRGVLNMFIAAKEFIFGSDDISEDVSHRVTSIDFPYRSYSTSKNTYGPTVFITPGSYEVGSCSLKMMEHEDGKTLQYLTNWQNLISNEDGTFNPPVAYKRDIILTRMSSTGADLHLSVYKNCFPVEISPSSFSYESGGVLEYSVTFAGDTVEHRILDVGEFKEVVSDAEDEINEDEVSAGLINRIKNYFNELF